MRFIIHLILFALLAYALWLYLPDVFQTIVSWIGQIFDWMRGLIEQLTGKKPATPTPEPEAPKAIYHYLKVLM